VRFRFAHAREDESTRLQKWKAAANIPWLPFIPPPNAEALVQ
jgi:hypothetical protein